MPHRELTGRVDLAAFHDRFAPRSLREGTVVSKAQACFLSSDRASLLVECLVVEGHLRQGFFLVVTERGGSTLVRIHSRSAPEKTPAVKRAVSWIAAWLQARSPGVDFGTTNLEAEALAPFPSEAIA